ncbi:MAG: efflux RND transporter permease subunit, partial [Clostridia bacterium]|nr:efflux RND transporter permease subunit [Clostridia bacterium]
INDSIANVLSSMLIGGALAIAVIYLFLRKARTSLIIAVTMPLSVLCALACLYFMGVTLNMVSLGGLAVGIGMLVDNSIVVIESISFERDKGKTAIQAAVDGTKLVAGSLLASTLTSVCVFFPILFTKGLSSMIFSDLSYSVIFSLTFSLIVAITVIPTLYCAVYSDKAMLAGKVLESRVKRIKSRIVGEEKLPSGKGGKRPRPRIMERLMRFYESFLKAALRRRTAVIITALVTFSASVGLVFLTGTEFMPSVDQRTIEVVINFDASDSLKYCEEQTRAVYDDIFDKIPDIKYISATVGMNALLATSNTGTIRILLNDAGEKTGIVLEKVREISENRGLTASVTEVDGVLASLMSGLGGFATISATIMGDDVETLKEITAAVREKTLAADERFKQVTSDLSDETLEYVIKIDKAKCLELGVDYKVAVGTLRAGIAGYTACTADINGENVNVTVRFKEGTVQEYYSGITGCVIGMNDKGAVTVGDVATVSSHYAPAIIKKTNGKAQVMLSAEVSGIDSGSASKIFTEIISEVLKEHEGCAFKESGMNYYLTEVFAGLIVAMIVSFVLLFAVMACQFESLDKPFIVIFAI